MSWVFPVSSLFRKVVFPRLKTAVPSKALQEQCNCHYVLQRSKWKTLAKKLLGHPARASALAATSSKSLPEIAHFHLERSKDFLTYSHLLEGCFRISSSDTDILLISSPSVFIGSLNPFLFFFFFCNSCTTSPHILFVATISLEPSLWISM